MLSTTKLVGPNLLSSSPTSPASWVCSGWPVKTFFGAGAVSIAPRCSLVLICSTRASEPGMSQPGNQVRPIDLGDVDDFRRVLGHLDVAGFLVADAEHLVGHEAGRDLVELRQDVPVVGHQQDGADVRDVADRAGLVHQPAVQIVAIEADHRADRRVEQEPRLLRDVHLEGEILRALQREERLAHRVLGSDQRQHRALGSPEARSCASANPSSGGRMLTGRRRPARTATAS